MKERVWRTSRGINAQASDLKTYSFIGIIFVKIFSRYIEYLRKDKKKVVKRRGREKGGELRMQT